MILSKKVFILALICVITQAGKLTFEGFWGDWTPPIKAPNNYYLCGSQVQFESHQGAGDDTAVNGINFIFCNRDNWEKQWESPHKGIWGFWMHKVFCPKGSFVNGMQVRFEGWQGAGDDTALNGLKLSCKSDGESQ